MQGRHATAALVVGKLCSFKRQQSALTSAIKGYGALRRTVYAAAREHSGTSRDVDDEVLAHIWLRYTFAPDILSAWRHRYANRRS